MRIIYVTTDELNRVVAARAARDCDAELDGTTPRGDRTPGPDEVMLYDLDHIEAEHRRAILDDLLSGRVPAPTAVHGYALTDEQVAALRARGVVVGARIGPEVIGHLCRVAARDANDRGPEPGAADPVVFGLLVRSLASAAYRLLSRPGTDSSSPEAAEIRGQLDELRRSIDRLHGGSGQRPGDLGRWLSNLRRLIDAHLRTDDLVPDAEKKTGAIGRGERV